MRRKIRLARRLAVVFLILVAATICYNLLTMFIRQQRAAAAIRADRATFYQPVNDGWLVDNGELCAERRNLSLVLLIVSRAGSQVRRDTIRASWKPALERLGFAVAFFVASPGGERLSPQLQRESALHGDMIVHPLKDSYRGLVNVSVALLEWAAQFCAPTDDGPWLVAKCDDDIAVNPWRLVQLVRKHMGRRGAIVGYIYPALAVIRDPLHQWFVGPNLYGAARWPPFAAGFMYLVSADLVATLYAYALQQPLVPLEDVFVTGLLAKRANATLIHVGPIFEPIYRPTLLKQHLYHLTVVHKLTPVQIVSLFNQQSALH